jgi:hypothetical protein
MLSSCGTPEQNARLTGLSHADAAAIGRAIHAKTSQQILSYERQPNGSVFVEVRSRTSEPDVYVATKSDGKWLANNNLMLVHREY